jgi:hypothetical protein
MDWRHSHRTWSKGSARFVFSAFPIDAIVTFRLVGTSLLQVIRLGLSNFG